MKQYIQPPNPGPSQPSLPPGGIILKGRTLLIVGVIVLLLVVGGVLFLR